MRKNRTSKFLNFLNAWSIYVKKNRLVLIISIISLAIASLFFIKNNLTFSTSTSDMLSEKLHWRQLDIKYEESFPQFLNNILIVIEAESPDLASDTAKNIYSKLKAEKKFLKDIYYPKIDPYFRQSSLLFLDLDELQDLSDRLARIQPFLGTLLEDKSLRGLFQMLGKAIDAKEDNESIDINPLLLEINRAFKSNDYLVSWERLMNPQYKSEEYYREFIELQINDEENKLLSNKDTIQHIRSIVNLYNTSSVNIRLTGSEVLAYEELKSVSDANIKAILLSIILVAIILFIGLGSLKIVLACLTTLLLGLIITTAFATFAIGRLNLISIAFAVLYIGLGIDFAIHMALRFKEEVNSSLNYSEVLKNTIEHISRPLILCAVTTAIGFYAFIPTNYLGVAELGLIAGTGMIISLILTFTLLPALLSYIPSHSFNNKGKTEKSNILKALTTLPYRHTKSILLLALSLVIILSLQVHKINFDANRLNLQDPSNESVQTYRDLLKNSETSPWEAILITKFDNNFDLKKKEIESLPLVNKTISIHDFLPNQQEDKLIIIDEISLLMGQLTTDQAGKIISFDEKINAAQELMSKVKKLPSDNLDKELKLFKYNLNSLLHELQNKSNNKILTDIEYQFLKNLPERIETLSDALNAKEVMLNEIPEKISSRWVSNNIFRIKIQPKEDLNDNNSMRKFVNELQSYNKNIIGSPVINIEAGDEVINAFKWAFIYAFISIALLLFFLMKIKYDAIIVLGSVLVGSIFTFGFMIIFNIPLNFANIIGLPLLLGIGVDSGIHITERFYEEKDSQTNIYTTSSMRGVIVSTLTTIFSIGNLAFSSHQGTASMGLLLSLGLLSMMLATMIILPSFLIWRNSLKIN